MAAPTFIAASTGATDAGGAWTATYTTTAASVVILQVLQDGTTADVLGTPPSVGADDTRLTRTGGAISSIAGTTGSFTWVGAFAVGSPTAAFQHLWIWRTSGATAITLTGANSTSEDLYFRFYEFSNVSTGTTLATVIENGLGWLTTSGSVVWGDATARTRYAQSIVANGTVISGCKLPMLKTGSPSDTITVALQADSAGVPSGTDLATATISGSSLTTSLADYEFTWTPATTTPGATYWIVLRRSGAVDGSNNYSWGSNAFSRLNVSSATYNPTTWTTGGNDRSLLVYMSGGADNVVGTSAAAEDASVTTLGPDRLALNFVAVNDDNAISEFTGETGGDWALATTPYAESSGTDGAIGLQVAIPGSTVGLLTGGDGSGFAIRGDGGAANEEVAQSFTSPSSSASVASVTVRVNKSSSPTGNLVVEVQSDSGGAPSGSVLGTASLAATTITTSFANYSLALTTAPLTASTTYWLVLKRDVAYDSINRFQIDRVTPSDYAGGSVSVMGGGSWAGFATYDAKFEIQFNEPITINGGTGSITDSDPWGVVGFALIGTTADVPPTLILQHGFVDHTNPGVL